TRAGSFQLDNLGYLKNDAGLYLQGWLADPVTGDITPDPSDLTQLDSINVGSVGGTAEKTTRAAVNANLRSEQPLSAQVKFSVSKASVPETVPASTGAYTVSYAETATAGIYDVEIRKGTTLVGTGTGDYSSGTLATPTGILATDPIDLSGAGTGPYVAFAGLGVGTDADLSTGNLYNSATNSMSDYALDATTGVKPDFEIQIPVSDSKGGQRTVTLSLLKSNTPNEWYAELRAKPGDLDNVANGLISSGRVTFTTDGKLQSVGNLFGGTNPTSITIGASDPNNVAATPPRWADSLGIDSQTLQIDLANAAGGLTQFNSQSVVQSVNTNGTAFGNLTNIEVDDEGYVSAIFDNGVTRRIAQVAVATFSNANGLKGVNGNAYRVTNESGTYSLKTPGQGGAGVIAPSTLEASTVDLSTEFTGLITTQRAYSASSKIITTADQMLEELLSIKR
ncbi:MAG TPA: flagellar hook-basal body complex protein, partial [Caulobacter sp.]|nr:flagellar hook-basal body complex protein [Caulobacter sp.]